MSATQTSEGIINAVREYRELGWNAIPLHRGSKRPAFSKGELRPHLYERPDGEVVRQWFREGRFGGVGIVTGATSGLCVVDCDNEEGKALLKEYGHPVTPMASTSKGTHLYFWRPSGDLPTSVRFAPGLDLKADGGYVAAPPTGGREWIIHPSECGLAELPEWVLERVRLRGPKAKFEPGEDIPNGERNDRLTSLAGKLQRVGFDVETILFTLAAENQRRCKPPLEDDEVLKIAQSMGRYEPGPEAENGKTNSSSHHIPYKGGDDDEELPPLEIKRFMDLPKPGPREAVIEKLLPKGYHAAIYGEGGTTKSFIGLSMLQAIARSDESWCGFKIERAHTCLFVDFEMDEAEQRRRSDEIAAGAGYDGAPENLHYLCAGGYMLRAVVPFVLRECARLDIEVVLIDSIGVALGGDPNAAKDVNAAFNLLDRLRRRSLTDILIDHQGKAGPGESYQSKTQIGSVYKGNNVRSRIQVQTREKGPGVRHLTLRQNKVNVSDDAPPFGVRVDFDGGRVMVGLEELPTEDLTEEQTLNITDRVVLALADGPAFPEDFYSQATWGGEMPSVKNAIRRPAPQKRGG
jgi:Bifunctional DNA primase/polymerase, N-terminal/AAA domain/Primase C terminal 1 (PriCT-1)